MKPGFQIKIAWNKAKEANNVRRVDRQTSALPDRPTDGHSQLQRCFGLPKKIDVQDLIPRWRLK